MAGQIDGTAAVSDIIKSVNLLLAIRRMVGAWGGGGGGVKPKVVTKGVNHVGMYPEKQEGARDKEADPFAGKELVDLQQLVTKVSQTSPGVSPGYAEVFDEDAPTHQPSIDSSDPNCRDNLRKEVIEQNRQGDAVELDNENDKYDQHLKAPAISSVKEVAKLANRMSEFADWHGMERLSSAVF